ncbi:hypothetical protein ACHAXM_002340 [Skeletonema potamos]
MLDCTLVFFLFATSTSPQHRRSSLVPLSKETTNNGTGDQSRWQRRTEKRRQRTEQLLDSIEIGSLLSLLPNQPSEELSNLYIPTLGIPQSSSIDWDKLDAELDPIRGGNLRQGSLRGLRKRAQIEAFHFIISTILHAQLQSSDKRNNDVTIIDAGSGAGNLAISLAGLSYSSIINIKVLAVDVNEHALTKLSNRVETILAPEKLETCCADLANYDLILSKIKQLSNHSVIVVSLHACGAASDMAMNLAIRCNAPFIICPCCTAKSLTKRTLPTEKDKRTKFDLSASFQRSGASSDIEYPRSKWLMDKLCNSDAVDMTLEEKYTLLAKVADVGLGPQTPSQQRQQQARAKKIVELDRLMAASEEHGYDVRLMRISNHDPLVYSKGDLLIGGKDIAEILINLPEE